MHFIDKIKAKAKSNPQIVVLPESYDDRMLFAAEKIIEQGLEKVVLLGNPAKVNEAAAAKGAKLTGVEILDPCTAPKLESYVDALVEIRKKKGLTPEDARKLLTAEDNLYFSGMMVRMGDAGGCVAGATSTTGSGLIVRVWIRVSASNSSSRVPKPPGNTTRLLARIIKCIFRTAK